MYEGWLSLAGTEIVNNERVRAYASAMVPGLSMPGEGCNGAPDGALTRLLDDEPYRTPTLDDAPWYDPDDPDTADFCGVFGLSVTGLDDSTRTATVTEHTADGGGITGRRKGTRSVRVSALLVGATQASIEAGMQWLSVALDGDCDGDCDGSDLCYLQAVVDPEDWGDRVTSPIDRDRLSAYSGAYNKHNHKFTPTKPGQVLSTPRFPRPLPCDEIIWTWDVSAIAGSQIRFRTTYDHGVAFSDVLTIDSDGRGTLSISDRGLGTNIAQCGADILIGTSFTVNSVNVEYRDEGKNSACFDHYFRQAREVSPTDGPTTITQYAPNNGALRQVEFTLTSAKPWVFGQNRGVVSYTVTNLQRVNANQDTPVFRLNHTIPVPSGPRRPQAVRDPDCPPIPAPPRSNAAFTDCKPSVDFYASFGVAIPAAMIPLWHDVVPSISLFAGEVAARGVRVRFFPRPLGDLQDTDDLDPHSACGQFVVDYIPPGAAFKLDGQTQHATVKVPGKPTSNADHLLSGMVTTDLFEWPVLSCGTDYIAVVDVDGNNRSLVSLSLSLTPRY